MSDSHSPIEPELLVATWSADSSLPFRNRAWERHLGTDDDPWSRLDVADAHLAKQLLTEASGGSLATNQLFLIPGPSGSEPRPLLLHFLPVHLVDDGRRHVAAVTMTGELLVQPDSWTESQTQRHRMETLGRMTMGIAHDFNNLLSGILGHTELMQNALDRDPDPEALAEHLRTIRQAGDDGAALIKKIQRYIRQEHEAAFEPVDLPALIQDCVVLTRPYWFNEPRRQGIAIAIEQQLDNVPAVNGSAAELRDVIVNLILNAVQAMPEGGLITFRTVHEAGRVRVVVQDTGTGMSESVRSRIFEPLFTTKGQRGTGMGLSVAYGIVQEHGGIISVTSVPQRGTTFLLDFPAGDQAISEPVHVASESNRVEARILIVDDERMVRTVLRRLLALRGYHVREAASGAEALDRLALEAFDLVITDQGMPEMNGREFATAAVAAHPGLPVVLLTGDTHLGETDAEIVAVLAKPFRIEQVDETIQRHARSVR